MNNKDKIRENMLRESLAHAIDYYIKTTNIDEIAEQCNWYRVKNIYDLNNTMFESYLNNYDDEELKERIKMLYDEE